MKSLDVPFKQCVLMFLTGTFSPFGWFQKSRILLTGHRTRSIRTLDVANRVYDSTYVPQRGRIFQKIQIKREIRI